MRLLVGYDGSAAARNALSVAARLFPDATAQLVYAWRPAGRPGDGPPADHDIDLEVADAEIIAAQGSSAAQAVGLTGTARAVEGYRTVGQILLDEIDRERPDIVVMGVGVTGPVPSRVSHAVIAQCPAPVLLVSLDAT